jgi:energy-coupling factor transporter transmembrane protein EcfT
MARSLRRAETIAIAMDVKGFGLAKTRTYFSEYPSWIPGKIFGWASIAIAVVLMATVWL